MEGQSNHENPVQLISFAFNGNARDVSHSPGDDPNQHYFMAGGGSQTHPFPLSLPHWIPCQKTSHYFSSEHADPSLDMDDQKVRFLRPHNEVGPMNFTGAESWINIQKQESSQDYCNVFQPHLSIAVAAPGLPPKRRRKVSRQRATATDRNRRLKIAEKLDVLEELLPHSKEGCKASVLDDIIDHIKYLQLQIKIDIYWLKAVLQQKQRYFQGFLFSFLNIVFEELFEIFENWFSIQNYLVVDKDLSKSKLAGESTSEPFIFLEGYGHYLFHEQMLDEPLEEIMGKLLEMNPSAAFKLLESRGLFMMPTALAEGLRQTA